MKKSLTLIISFIFCANNFLTQTWKSSPKDSSFKVSPSQQFSINPYTNDLWFVNSTKTIRIKTDGSIIEYGINELGYLPVGNKIKFAFIHNRTFFAKDFYGLFELTDLTSNLIYLSESFEQISTNLDTLYLTIPFEHYLKFVNDEFISSNHTGRRVISKHSYLYRSLNENGSLVRQTGTNSSDYVYYSQTDDEYICSQYHDIKFSRLTDTLFVGCEKGISFAFNYDFLDTITPFNTNNMPSANVLEMEFDLQDRMWAVFGDANDMPFAIAMLENDTWINYFDASNSPIQFVNDLGQKTFWGLEIDTLGNVWVCDSKALHTLINENTPAWIGINEIEQETFDFFPNPVEDELEIHFKNSNSQKEIQLIDLNNKVLFKRSGFIEYEKISFENLKSGIYILSVCENNHVYYKKIIKK